jgi:hypothetical protein
VDIEASLGIFSKLLFKKIKLILENTAKVIAKMNFQLNSILTSVLSSNKLPEIKFLSPSNTIDIAEEKQ